MISDFEEIGRSLAEQIRKNHRAPFAIFASPGTPLILGKTIALSLNADLDVILVRKVTAPENPNVAIGAISESGHFFIDESARLNLVPEEYIQEQIKAGIEFLREQRTQFRTVRPSFSVVKKTAIIVNDGSATGAMLITAIRSLRYQKPDRIIIAIPRVDLESMERVYRECDGVVTLDTQTSDLDQTPISDKEAYHILHQTYLSGLKNKWGRNQTVMTVSS